MKLYEYISHEDWNALGHEKQLALQAGLQFVGYPVNARYFPDALIGHDLCAYLDHDGDLCAVHTISFDEEDRRISLSEVLSFIELTSFQANE